MLYSHSQNFLECSDMVEKFISKYKGWSKYPIMNSNEFNATHVAFLVMLVGCLL
jgi:hypothetical protein